MPALTSLRVEQHLTVGNLLILIPLCLLHDELHHEKGPVEKDAAVAAVVSVALGVDG